MEEEKFQFDSLESYKEQVRDSFDSDGVLAEEGRMPMMPEETQQSEDLRRYKEQVRGYLRTKFSETITERLMKDYEPDFPMFLRNGWEPSLGALMIRMGY